MKHSVSILIIAKIIFFKQVSSEIPWHSILRFRFCFMQVMLVYRSEIFLVMIIFDLLNHVVILCSIIIVESNFSFERIILNSFYIDIWYSFFIALLLTWCLRRMRINWVIILSVCKRSSILIVVLTLWVSGNLQRHLIFQ